MPALIEDVHWTTVRSRYSPLAHTSSAILHRRATVSPTEYLTVKQQDGEWRWDVFTYREHDVLGKAMRLSGGSRDTMRAAKQAALEAWINRPEPAR